MSEKDMCEKGKTAIEAEEILTRIASAGGEIALMGALQIQKDGMNRYE